jgi:hypothetical protein
MSSFAPTALPQVAPDPTKHVNYVAGMVLGVDDFQQEYANLSGHDARIVRDLIGYGVVAGLAVTIESDTAGTQVQVSPGEAVTPSGRLICIEPAQCALIDDWLLANRISVEELGSPPGSPPAGLPLYVVACYRECPTDDVPIPGEPCRSDDELMAPSRLKESFSLELRLEPPAQLEETAVREFVAWAKRIPLVDTPGPGIDAFLGSLRHLLGLDSSPPSSPPTLLDDLLASPPYALAIPSGDVAAYRAALLRFWVEELRPRLRSPVPGAECGCGCGGPGELDPDADCVLLAELEVPLTEDLAGNPIVADTPPVVVDESTRPTLLHLRFLQEWLLDPSDVLTVSGTVDGAGNVIGATGGLSAQNLVADTSLYLLDFPGFDPTLTHVVVGTPTSWYGAPYGNTFEVLDPAHLSPITPPSPGIVVRVAKSNGQPTGRGFSVRIEQLGGAV